MSALLAGSMSPRPGEVGSAQATGVLVYAKDPVSRAGVTSQLAGWRDIDLLDPRQGHLAEVAVVVAETIDEEVLRVIRTIRRGSQAQVVLVVTDVDERAASAAAEAGAIGLLRRRAANGDQLASVIGKARQGVLAMPPPDDRRTGAVVPGGATLKAAARPDQQAETGHSLTARDIDVLRLLSEGCDTADIAQRLAYSEPTIKNVIQRLFDQLKVRNRPHAVAVAMRAGII
jgi:DNA-binding NarL/FixJ family response regulator